ncbi:putative pre-mRNA-splicing factor cwc-24 [Triangularia verruculosa]|uniref:Pre-mRNA-splicing factor CWC24 n=1 Tax=Triangularia verruculosa TaxID=2587418 RepID=A0AAN6XKP0_9PEZI|nr:putative pre-mRNA-splicing factor cwc-24 [Triangularia verruculosa]
MILCPTAHPRTVNSSIIASHENTGNNMTDPAPAAPVAIFKKRGAKAKANIRKRPATPPPANSDSDSDFSSSEDEAGRRIKRRKRNTTAVVTASSKEIPQAEQDLKATIFTTDRASALALDSSKRDATKQSNWFDEDKNLSAKSLLGSTRSMPSSSDNRPDGTYKGLANAASYIQKNPDAPSRKVGPIKAPTNIRTITITDMAPDVCKDYKNTGFCGFGDNCKFLHAREDYAHGWQLDREWENVTKGKKIIGGTVVASAERKANKNNNDEDDRDEEEEAMLEKIPFVCIICRGDYKSPVVTRCGHYFCEACALKRYRKDPSCAACGSGTNGVFNAAKKLQKLLVKKKERAAKRRQEAIENGEEVSSEDEDED